MLQIMHLSNHNHDQMMMDACINLLKSKPSSYSDIKVVSNDGVVSYTSKVLVFLSNPSLGGVLLESDLILLGEEHRETATYLVGQDDVQSQTSMIESYSQQTIEQSSETLQTIEEKHLCQICGRVFSSKKLLQEHNVGLSNENSNTRCHICHKQLCSRPSLNKHLMVHTDLIHECPICKVKIKHLRNFRRHVKIHEKRYVNINCDLCSGSFKSNSNYQRHLKNIHKL